MNQTTDRPRQRVDLRARYRAEIESWDWKGIAQECRDNLFIDDGLRGSSYLGSVLHLYPSGKVYAFWTSNQSRFDEIKDSIFNEELEAIAEEHGLYIGGSEGDGCDILAFASHGDEYYRIESEGEDLVAYDEQGNEYFRADGEVFDREFRATMERDGFSPDLVTVTDHGNVMRYTLDS